MDGKCGAYMQRGYLYIVPLDIKGVSATSQSGMQINLSYPRGRCNYLRFQACFESIEVSVNLIK